MPTLILVRHGQSQWNLENRFTGWWDVDLTEKGVAEAVAAGELLAHKGVLPTRAFTSLQTRAIKTLHLALEACGRLWIPETKDWRLNERHYGGLTGLDKQETREKHGDEQVHVWRRSFDVPPPPVDPTSPEHPLNDPTYQRLVSEGLDPTLLPATECLKDVLERVLPYWNEEIVPQLRAGTNVLVTAHGNSLRALIMHLESMSDEAIVDFNMPTGVPRLYEFDDTMKVRTVKFLGDQQAIAKAAEAVAQQAGH